MIVVDSNIFDIIIRKALDESFGEYFVVLHHNFTRSYYTVVCTDISTCAGYYHFHVELPENYLRGEYTYYITPYLGEEFTPYINTDDPRKSYFTNGSEISGINILQKGIMQYLPKKQFTEYDIKRVYDQYDPTLEGSEYFITNSNIKLTNSGNYLTNITQL